MDKNKKLYRSEKDKMIGGVAAGLAEYFDVDPVIVRVFLVLLGLASGVFPMIIAYLILMVIIPKEGQNKNEEIGEKVREAGQEIKDAASELTEEIKNSKIKNSRLSSPKHWIGLVLILIGLSMIWNIFSPFYFHVGGRFLMPAIILVFGFFLIFSRSRHER